MIDMETARATITDFLRDTDSVLRKVTFEDVLLSRQGHEPVLLTDPSRARLARTGVEIASYLLSHLLERDDPAVTRRISELLLQKYPWTKFLPEDERGEFTREMVETLHACASIGNSAKLEELLISWESTARIHADPKLAAELKRPITIPHGQKVRRP